MTPSRPDRSRGLFALSAIAATAFVVLAVLVAAHATQDLDVAARNHFRPHDVWGTTQMRVDVVVEGLKPSKVLPLLALVAVVACVRRRSWRPAAYAALLAAVTGALTMRHQGDGRTADPHHDMTAVGGSFPSGHTVTVLICLGGAILLLQERPRWWEWAVVGLVGMAMGLALLLQAAHWFTDVVGGLLLGLAVLAAAVGFRLRGTDLRLRGGGSRPRRSSHLRALGGRGTEELAGEPPELASQLVVVAAVDLLHDGARRTPPHLPDLLDEAVDVEGVHRLVEPLEAEVREQPGVLPGVPQ